MRCVPPSRWPELVADRRMTLAPTLLGLPHGRFRATATWDTGQRAIDEHLVYVVARGRLIARFDDDERIVAAGEACVVPPRTRFRFAAGRPVPAIERFRLVLARGNEPFALLDHAVVTALDATLKRAIDAVLDELSRPRQEAIALRAAATLFVVALGRGLLAGDDGLGPARLAQLIERVGDDPRCTPRDLARSVGLSHDWFARVLRRATGLPPRRWIVRERIRMACVRLASGGETAEQVARGLGYRDGKLFGRQFRAVMGVPPATWRRRAERFA